MGGLEFCSAEVLSKRELDAIGKIEQVPGKLLKVLRGCTIIGFKKAFSMRSLKFYSH